MKKTILMTGTFDSKGKEFDYLYRELLRRGVSVIAMDVGVFAPVSSFPVAVTAGEVAKAGGASLEELRREADRGHAMRVMCSGARHYAVKLQKEGAIQGIIGMGAAAAPLLRRRQCRDFRWDSRKYVSRRWRREIPGSMWVPETLYCSRPLWTSAGSTAFRRW